MNATTQNRPLSTTRSRIILVTIIVLFALIYTKFPSSSTSRDRLSVLSRPKCSENGDRLEEQCQWSFLNYTPSAWESEWYNNIQVLQHTVCETLAKVEHVNRTILALQQLIELQKGRRNQTNGEQHPSDVLFSRMFYHQECLDARTKVVSHLIEPFIGLLRDPLSVCSRLDASLVPASLYDGAILLSRRFLLLSPSAPYSISSLDGPANALPPWVYARSATKTKERRLILFDLGSSAFGAESGEISDTSTRWLYEYYRRFGLKFDRIIAFEAAPLDPKLAWNQLPDDVLPVYTLINTGCTVDGKLHPWTILRGLVTAADHVVVKVDIDHFEIENRLMDQVVNDSRIHSLIDELFFEHHVSVKEMRPYWRPPPGTLQDSYVLFTKLRRLGIRMHSWP